MTSPEQGSAHDHVGFSARIIHNNTSSYANSFPRYGYGATELIGLGRILIMPDKFHVHGSRAFGANPGLPIQPRSRTEWAILGLVNDDFHTTSSTGAATLWRWVRTSALFH